MISVIEIIQKRKMSDQVNKEDLLEKAREVATSLELEEGVGWVQTEIPKEVRPKARMPKSIVKDNVAIFEYDGKSYPISLTSAPSRLRI
jgi:hypothetical protein